MAFDKQATLRNRVVDLLEARQYPKTICPSEVARSFTSNELHNFQVTEWRELMDPIRKELWAWRDAGNVEILQRGVVLDPTTTLEAIKGPIRVRKSQDADLK